MVRIATRTQPQFPFFFSCTLWNGRVQPLTSRAAGIIADTIVLCTWVGQEHAQGTGHSRRYCGLASWNDVTKEQTRVFPLCTWNVYSRDEAG